MARAPVPDIWLERVRSVMAGLPETREERAWTGLRWTVRGSNVAHLFGGEDQLIRISFRAEMAEVPAFEHLGPRYFRVGGSGNVVGMVLDDDTDAAELAELLTDSYCLQAPQHLSELVDRPA
ncbi:MmcQ/YjbR family DNA-binding protein [Aeromicrobium sp. CTD01-1L150]|uniref:MmcQ/YjbR family DNA-binding protein n=1 Tax=Aeromicrobium sp. CTD01-1L150 TaxID=3341830 RepID=UPI0035C067C5